VVRNRPAIVEKPEKDKAPAMPGGGGDMDF